VQRRELDAAIDRLYQLPPEEFVAARNQLAKEVLRDDVARVRTLARPVAPAWAVNQLYWRARPAYDRLVAAADALRKAHKALAAGRKADLRAFDREYDAARAEALRETLRLLQEAGHEPSPNVEHAISETLSALPSDEPGRLTKPLKAPGFGSLLGLAAAGPAPTPAKLTLVKPAGGAAATGDRDRKAAEKEAARIAQQLDRARKAHQEAERARREADAAARKAADALARARRAEEEARARFDRAGAERAGAEVAARRAQDEAERAARKADEAAAVVEEARRRQSSA
jgi:hypothetical protein